jgi:hypothetical protein
MSIVFSIGLFVVAVGFMLASALCLVGAVVPRWGARATDAEATGLFAFALLFAVAGLGMMFLAGSIL